MFEDALKHSAIVTLVREDADAESATVKALLRVHDLPAWSKLVVQLLLAAVDTEFGVSVRKEYLLAENKTPKFVWVLLVWGDLTAASVSLLPLLSRAEAVVGPPEPVARLSVAPAKTAPRAPSKSPPPVDDEAEEVIRAPALSAGVRPPAVIADSRKVRLANGMEETHTIVRLPHRPEPQRNTRKDRTKKLSDHGKGKGFSYAFAEGIDGDGGDPWR